MTFILTNDDGIDFPCPPKEQHSGCGHRVTTNRPIHLKKRSDSEYVVDGTPADCTRLALTQVAKETKWVLSGINAGGNLGVDIYISGTVAAVREAAIHGVPGIAISHWIKRPLVIDWDLATKWTAKVLEKLW
ncbi:MAG: 5'/3'-nucleotidase SurE, partial [cyanobacterium endosymbiont of Rhopalodia fuxianensis]